MQKRNIIWIALVAVILTGCGNSTINDSEEEKAYSLTEIENFDGNFNEVYGISNVHKFVVFADQGAYLYSNDKIYTNGTHFNLEYEVDFTQAWIGTDRNEFHNLGKDGIEPILSGGYPETLEVILSNNNTSDIVCIDTFMGTYYGYKTFVNERDKIRVYNEVYDVSFEEEGVLEMPNGEVIEKTIWGKSGVPMYLSDQNHIYYYGISEDDPSNTYADVDPTYTLVEDKIYEELKEDFKDNILFYNGYLITKDGKCYDVQEKIQDSEMM